MKNLRDYLNSLPIADQEAFAKACGTTIGYLRKAISANQRLSETLVINIERESGGRVTVADLRPSFAEALTKAGYQRRRPCAACEDSPMP